MGNNQLDELKRGAPAIRYKDDETRATVSTLHVIHNARPASFN